MASYFDSVEQTGLLHELQGSAREAQYYYERGLELALAIRAEKIQRKFSLRLAQLDLKRRRWNAASEEMSEGGLSVGGGGSLLTQSVAEGLLAAELREHVGDVRRQIEKSLPEAAELYKQAEDTILPYTDVSMLDQLEILTSSVTMSSSSTATGKKTAKKTSVTQTGLTPRADKILSRLPTTSKGRLSMEPSSASTRSPHAAHMLPLRQLQIRSRAKRGLVELALAKQTLTPSQLDAAKTIFDECVNVILELLDDDDDVAVPTPSVFDLDLAFLFFQQAKVAFTALTWPLAPATVKGLTPLDQLWSAQPHKKSAAAFSRVGSLLDKALQLASRAGAHPVLVTDICNLYALVLGRTDPLRTSALLHYALGSHVATSNVDNAL